MKSFLVNNIQGPNDITGVFWTIKINVNTYTLKLLQNSTVVGKPSILSYEYSITPRAKPKITQKRKTIDQYHTDEHRYKLPQQNTPKKNPTTQEKYQTALWSEVFPRYANILW